MPSQAQSEPGGVVKASITPFRGHVDTTTFTLPGEPVSPLLGRERELQIASDLLRDDTIRLLTITGPGGIGKTRLALRLAHVMHPAFGDGAAFVPLATISDPALVAVAVAQALKLSEVPGMTALERIYSGVRNRHIFLVLDNVEQVRGAAASIAAMLATCPHVKILATSRIPLHLSGEQEFAIPPLELPADTFSAPSELSRFSSIALFTQRARAVKADFNLDHTNAAAVATICQRLDGLPLAIELAAARSKVLSPVALLARLANSLDVLTGGPTDQPDRLQTLRAAIRWSYDLLKFEEQRMFNRLAIFSGGFSLEAAEAIIECEMGAPAQSVLDMVSALVDSNLLYARDAKDGETRFGMLETIREFGLERLAEGGDTLPLCRRHAEWCLELADRAWPVFARRMDMEPWLDRFETEHDNFRAALKWSIDMENGAIALQLAGRLSWFWYLRGFLAEGRSWLERSLALPVSTLSTARPLALYGVSLLAHWQGDDAYAVTCLEEALSLWNLLGDGWGTTVALGALATVATDAGDYEKGATNFQMALAQARSTGDQPNIALFLNNCGLANWGLGNETLAIEYAEEALALHQDLGNVWGAAISFSFLGLIACERREYQQASGFHRKSLTLRMQMGIRKDIAQCLANIASLETALDNDVLAVRLFGAADAVQERIGHSMKEPERSVYDRALSRSRERLGETRFAAAWEAGRRLSLTEASAAALNDADTLPAAKPPPGAGDLTSRERDVLLLLVMGQTDREIANSLYISPRTAQGHVARIFDKLEVKTRTAAVSLALTEGLVDTGNEPGG